MARPPPTPPGKLTSEEYLLWAEAQQRGRFELVAGKVFALAPERIGHTRVKAHAWLVLSNAINAAGADAEAFPNQPVDKLPPAHRQRKILRPPGAYWHNMWRRRA